MDAVVAHLAGTPGRGPCTDAERRCSLWLHDRLAAAGHEAFVDTHWVRPQWPASLFWHATLGVAASLVSTALPLPALILAAVLLVSWVVEASGRGSVLRLLFFRRATQVVLVEPADGISLLITANVDAPRRGLVFRDGIRRRFRRLPALSLVAAALVVVVVAAALRTAGIDEEGLGVVQFVPTVLLLFVAAVGLDIWLSTWSAGASDNASGVAAALALHERLVEGGLSRLSPGLALAGAGEAWPYGFAAHLRRDRPDRAATVVLEFGPCGAGSPVCWSRHRQIAAAGEAAEVPRHAVRRPGAAQLARSMRIPAVRVQCVDERGHVPRSRTPADTADAVDEAAIAAAVDAAEAIVRELDAELAATAATEQ